PKTVTPAPSRAPAPPRATSPATIRPHAPDRGTGVLHWIVVLVAAAIVFQLVSLALRPLRRYITLRHLRHPFWSETVDQQISNSWQLALVGLRDGGWRATSSEPPREFARRVGVEGVERCATILERAQHGIRIDAEDLESMSASADAAYHSARSRLGSGARAAGWIRWPLT
nr:hypothetical protein [Deltaproteobacteria bacterium]